MESNRKRRHRAAALLATAWMLAAPCAVHAADIVPLPELAVDGGSIAPDTCRVIEWRLPHVVEQLLICHVPSGGREARAVPSPDSADLVRQAVEWRERTVDEALANAIHAMQHHLDGTPGRSLHPDWRVLINQGIWGCVLGQSVSDEGLVFADPCTGNRYSSDGRPLATGYPALAIPPYDVRDGTLTIGRLPASLPAPPDPLPALDFDALVASPTARLIRAARWGEVDRARALLAAGTDVNATDGSGSTALLIAVQMRQPDMVAFLLSAGADPRRAYPDGLGSLELARIVGDRDIEDMLIAAGATADTGRR